MGQAPLNGRIIKLKDIPKRQRNAVPKAFKVLDMWPDAELAMEEDRIGVGEAYVFVVPEDVMEEYDFKNIIAVARPIKKYVKTRYKTKYKVLARNTSDGPTILICRPKLKG